MLLCELLHSLCSCLPDLFAAHIPFDLGNKRMSTSLFMYNVGSITTEHTVNNTHNSSLPHYICLLEVLQLPGENHVMVTLDLAINL